MYCISISTNNACKITLKQRSMRYRVFRNQKSRQKRLITIFPIYNVVALCKKEKFYSSHCTNQGGKCDQVQSQGFTWSCWLKSNATKDGVRIDAIEKNECVKNEAWMERRRLSILLVHRYFREQDYTSSANSCTGFPNVPRDVSCTVHNSVSFR